jgi:hypothetical protein
VQVECTKLVDEKGMSTCPDFSRDLLRTLLEKCDVKMREILHDKGQATMLVGLQCGVAVKIMLNKHQPHISQFHPERR